MKLRDLASAGVLLFLAVVARAQGVEAPPVTSFQPDSSMPKVNVPEFVITGKARIELPRADKPTVLIDSSFFQSKEIPGVDVVVPANRTISVGGERGSGPKPSLFARASIGHYTTASYLVSGGDGVGGYLFNGSLSGDYTSGYIPYTMARDFSLSGGVAKDFLLKPGLVTTNSLNLGYSRSSYFLYGGIGDVHRTINSFSGVFQSGLSFADFPLNGEVSYKHFSIDDGISATGRDAQSDFGFELSGSTELPSGTLALNASIHAGNHTISSPFIVPSPYGPLALDRSNYNFTAGVGYVNKIRNLYYSIAVYYYQYRDDIASGVGKVYPDINATYRIDKTLSLFARFHGKVTRRSLSSILASDRYVDFGLPIVSTQDYADLTLGGNLVVSDELTLTPSVRVQGARYLPVFVCPELTVQSAPAASADNSLMYADRATVYSGSISARFKEGNLSASGDLTFQSGKTNALSSIPNLPPVALNLKGTYMITPEFAASADFLFLSARYSDFALSEKVDPAARLNFRLSYDVRIARLPLEIFAGGNNVLNQKYFIWQGYQEFPLTLYVGLSSRIF